ncbi:hypothetical protein [Aurantiacibacter luteus]|uniref:TonB C-terminal domain-containing protein n=1 Tax=Aurantiacibacter luteus TaxID=1581420 RepID=A0A0G9MV32_9SPHN|nr:hypothetical protein [Aurantiacibacter luteus]KLE34429.1 hypothetical protein AAW00_09405 [Aurantiacibacter luteus]
MSRWLAVILALALLPCPALAQQAYGPTAAAESAEPEEPVSATDPCETEAREDGAILVCRELPDTERYRSPLPRPVQSDRTIIPGLTDPPCWVQSKGEMVCIRMGWAPPPALMVDLSIYPEDLTEEEAAHVVTAEGPPVIAPEPVTGRRVAIDLSED